MADQASPKVCEGIDWDSAEWQSLKNLEASYLAGLQAWDVHNLETGEWCPRGDKYERRTSGIQPRVHKMIAAKAQANWAVAHVAAESARQKRGTDGVAEAAALVLDGADATTASALVAQGFLPERVLLPNTVPSVAEALRCKGFRAWAGRVQDYLRAPVLRPLDLVYLDHTGAFPRRAGQIRALFENRIVGPGSVIACTFSTRQAPWEDGDPGSAALPKAWSRAHAVYALVHVLLGAARAQGLELEGPDLEGLADYGYAPPPLPGGPASGGPPPGAPPEGAGLRGELAAALGRSDLAALAGALAAWAAGRGAPAAAPAGELGFLAHRAAVVAARALPALGPGPGPVLGAAWARPSGEPRPAARRGRPQAVLGAAGAVQDADAAALQGLAARVLSELEAPQEALAPEAERAEAPGGPQGSRAGLTLRGCLLLYPEQMMFVIVRVVAPVHATASAAA